MPQNQAQTPSPLSAKLASSKEPIHEHSAPHELLSLKSDQQYLQASEVTNQAPAYSLAASEVSKALSPTVTVDGKYTIAT